MAVPGLTVLQVIPELDAGGAERTTLEIVEALKRQNARALVVSEGGRMEDELKALGGELIRLPVKSKSPLTIRKNANAISAIVKAEGVDIIHARSRAPAWSALWAARQTETPFVTTYHGTYGGKSKPKKLYNSVMARGDLVIANSDFIADHVKAVHKLSAEKIITIPRGADTDHLNPEQVNQNDVDELRQELRNGRRFVFTLPARLTEWKGQRVFIEALSKLTPEHQALISAHLIGDAQGRNDYVDGLKSIAKDLGVDEIIRISGHRSDMPVLYAASDLILAPSTRPEAFGRVAIEAGAMAVPVIVSDHGGQRETVLNGETGWRVPPNDAAALADAISAFLALSDAKRREMGKLARDFVCAKFTTINLQEKTLQVYRDVLAQKRSPA